MPKSRSVIARVISAGPLACSCERVALGFIAARPGGSKLFEPPGGGGVPIPNCTAYMWEACMNLGLSLSRRV